MRSLIALLAAGSIIGTTAAARAAVLTQTHTYGPQLTDFSLPATFNLFNSTLGTLNDVTFSDSYGFTSTITLSNNGSPSNGVVKSESLLGLSSGNAAINAVIANQVDTNGAAAGGVVSAAFDILGKGYSYVNFTGVASPASNGTTQSASAVDTTSADLQAFQAAGGGTFTVGATTFTVTDLSNTGGNTSATQSTIGTAAFSITYDYTAAPPPVATIPEPAALAIFGAGLLVIGVSRRRFT